MNNVPLTFIDIFAGCGGLSLGLFQAGWRGLFAVEADRFAFESLQHNLLGNGPYSYDWPDWLPKKPRNISGFIEEYERELRALVGKVGVPSVNGSRFALSLFSPVHAMDRGFLLTT